MPIYVHSTQLLCKEEQVWKFTFEKGRGRNRMIMQMQFCLGYWIYENAFDGSIPFIDGYECMLQIRPAKGSIYTDIYLEQD